VSAAQRTPGYAAPLTAAGIMTTQADAACARMLEEAGFPPGQAHELVAQIRTEVRALGPPNPELLEEIYELLGVSGQVPGRGAT
jgi:hypothetical protein